MKNTPTPLDLNENIHYRVEDRVTRREMDMRRIKDTYQIRDLINGEPEPWFYTTDNIVQYLLSNTKHLTFSDSQARTMFTSFQNNLSIHIQISITEVIDIVQQTDTLELFDKGLNTVLLVFKDGSQLFFGETFQPRFEVVA